MPTRHTHSNVPRAKRRSRPSPFIAEGATLDILSLIGYLTRSGECGGKIGHDSQRQGLRVSNMLGIYRVLIHQALCLGMLRGGVGPSAVAGKGVEGFRVILKSRPKSPALLP